MQHSESVQIISKPHRLHRMDELTNEFGNRAFDLGFPELASLLSKFSLQTSRQINELLDQALQVYNTAEIAIPESNIPDEYRIDSRIIAEKLGVEHKNLLETLSTYSRQIQSFGTFAFETRKSAGRPTRYALLNENQCYLLATLSRNTDRVVDFKVWLVKTFAEHRGTVKPTLSALPESATVREWAAITGKNIDSVTRQIRRTLGTGFSLDTTLSASQWIGLYNGRQRLERLPKAQYYTVSGWLNLHNFRPESLEQSQQLGRKCVALSNELGYEIRKIHSEQFGEINAYHNAVLRRAVPIKKTPF